MSAILIIINLLSGVAALLIKDPGPAKTCSILALVAFLITQAAMPPGMDIRVDLLLTIPLTMAALAVFIQKSRGE